MDPINWIDSTKPNIADPNKNRERGKVGALRIVRCFDGGMARILGWEAIPSSFPWHVGIRETTKVTRGVRGSHPAAAYFPSLTRLRLAWDVPIPLDALVPIVQDGWVTLNGEVRWHLNGMQPNRTFGGSRAFVGVTNKLTVKPRVDVDHVSDDITHALHRSWLFDPKLVTVTADGGTVRLTGTAPT